MSVQRLVQLALVVAFVFSPLALLLSGCKVDAARVRFNTFKEIQARTFRQGGSAIDPKWGTRVAVASNGKAAVVSSLKDTIQFLDRAPYGWIESGPRVSVPGAMRVGRHQGFGPSVAVSGDGRTAIVGGSRVADAQERGLAFVFAFASNRTWVQQARLETQSIQPTITASSVVAISDDGNTVALGAMLNNYAAVYLWFRSAGAVVWTSQGSVFGPTTPPFFEIQKNALTLSANGNVLAVGADDNNNRGVVFIYRRTENRWDMIGTRLNASNIVSGTFFGGALSLSGDGLTLAVGGWGAAGPAPGNQANMGRVWIFTSNGVDPFVQAGAPIIPPFNLLTTPSARFGSSVQFSKDGKTIVVGAPDDDASSGSFFVYQRPNKASMAWTLTRIAPSSVSGAFGTSVAVSGDGKVIISGAPEDDNRFGTLWFFETKNLACQI